MGSIVLSQRLRHSSAGLSCFAASRRGYLFPTSAGAPRQETEVFQQVVKPREQNFCAGGTSSCLPCLGKPDSTKRPRFPAFARLSASPGGGSQEGAFVCPHDCLLRHCSLPFCLSQVATIR